MPNRKVTIFLLGPSGAGKTTVGTEACRRLGLVFAELLSAEDLPVSQRDAWRPPGDLIELSWALQSDNSILRLARQLGHAVLLWAHPETMAARAKNPVALTPRPGLVTRSGFGRRGTSALEFRRLDRGCNQTLMLDGVSVSDAVAALAEIINEKRRNDTDPDACEGLARWFEESWGVGKAVHVHAVAQAMADYIAARVASGASQRSVRALQSDLQLAGLLYFHSWRASKKALDDFRSGIAADEIEFRRKASDAPAQVARYLKAVDDFQRYLKGRL